MGAPQVRRLTNRFFFEELRVGVEDVGQAPTGAEGGGAGPRKPGGTPGGVAVAGASFREPWDTLLDSAFQERMRRGGEADSDPDDEDDEADAPTAVTGDGMIPGLGGSGAALAGPDTTNPDRDLLRVLMLVGVRK
jgi:hypothetical protein